MVLRPAGVWVCTLFGRTGALPGASTGVGWRRDLDYLRANCAVVDRPLIYAHVPGSLVVRHANGYRTVARAAIAVAGAEQHVVNATVTRHLGRA